MSERESRRDRDDGYIAVPLIAAAQ